MSMPIYGDMKDVTFQGHPFYPVVESPGVVFIVKKEDSTNAAKAVMDAVFQGWPVLLLTLIMAALSGIIIWALVSTHCILKKRWCRVGSETLKFCLKQEIDKLIRSPMGLRLPPFSFSRRQLGEFISGKKSKLNKRFRLKGTSTITLLRNSVDQILFIYFSRP